MIRKLVACGAFGVLLSTHLGAEPMKAGDRQRLLAHLEMTESWLISELNGLSPAQLTYKMTPDSWSIADVTEHLAIAEPQYWEQLQKSIKQPPTTEKLEATDAAILWYGIDRSNRQKTGEARVPHGTFKSAAEPFVRAYVMGDPRNAKTTLGPIAQPWHPKELEAFVADAREFVCNRSFDLGERPSWGCRRNDLKETSKLPRAL